MRNVLLIIAVIGLTACSKLTQENYDALKMGMSLEEISGVIGEPDECSDTLGTKSCLWGSEDGTYIKISFVGNNAATFSKDKLK